MEIFMKILDQENITNIYIGITGILVAIVIFIAEIIKEQPNELNRMFILTQTEIKENVIFILIVFVHMIYCNIFKDEKKITYMITHITLLILVVYAIYITGKMFWMTLKLNIEKKYFNEKLEKYVYKKVVSLENKANKKSKKGLNKEKQEFKSFIKKQEIYFSDKLDENLKKFYEPIYPLKNGIIKKYNYDKLIELSNVYAEQKISEEEYSDENENVVYIINNIGKKVEKETAIFYCLKKYKRIFNNINEWVIYEDNRMYINEEIKLINNSLFEMALDYNEPDDFDENNRLFNYFEYLYKKNLIGIKQFAINNTEEMYRKVYSNFLQNKQFCKFLNALAFLIYTNNDYENYKYINSLRLRLYLRQLEFEDIDSKEVTYNFTNNVLRYNLYSLKKNSSVIYYDNLMSILFRFLINLIKKEKYDEIKILIDNILIEKNNYGSDELYEHDIINFQICCGIIYAFVILSDKDKLKHENCKDIKKIISYFNNQFNNLYDIWETIQCFRKYFNKSTCVKDVYGTFDFYFVEHKYKNYWSGYCIDERLILKEVLYVFNINFIKSDKIKLDEISKDDKYYYQELLRIINTNEKTKLEEYLGIRYDNTSLIKLLKNIINSAEAKEREYNRVNRLSNEKISNFKKLLFMRIKKETEFIKLLKMYNKVEESDIKLKRVYGIDQLVPRELFFEGSVGDEMLVDSYCNALNSGIRREYARKIQKMSQNSSITLEAQIEKINNLDEYVIVSNHLNYRLGKKYKYDYNKNIVIFNNKSINVIRIPNIDGIYLIKKNYLPIIRFCKYDNEWENKYINNSIYYEFVDCSKNDNLRKKFIENATWLKEKGTNEEQENYLKECCRIRIYLSYEIIKIKDSFALKFGTDTNK